MELSLGSLISSLCQERQGLCGRGVADRSSPALTKFSWSTSDLCLRVCAVIKCWMAAMAWSSSHITQASFPRAKSCGQTAHCMRFVSVLFSASDKCKPNNHWPQAERVQIRGITRGLLCYTLHASLIYICCFNITDFLAWICIIWKMWRKTCVALI